MTCGGYKIVWEVGTCRGCGREYYTTPGCYTIYEGKRFTTVDGLQLVYMSRDKRNCPEAICIACAEKYRGEEW
jgi:hypothetical protein